jgi:hypothetical protein
MTTPAPVTPTLSLATDKATYSVGDPITVTATYSDSTVAPVQLSITASATDPAGNTVNAEVSVTVNTAEQQAMTIGITDSFGDQYTVVSNAAGVAVLSSVIGTPPAAPAA